MTPDQASLAHQTSPPPNNARPVHHLIRLHRTASAQSARTSPAIPTANEAQPNPENPTSQHAHSPLLLHLIPQLHTFHLHSPLALMLQYPLIRFAMLRWSREGIEVIAVVSLLVEPWGTLADLEMSRAFGDVAVCAAVSSTHVLLRFTVILQNLTHEPRAVARPIPLYMM